MARIGTSDRNSWIAEDGHIDLRRGRPDAHAATIATSDETITVDLAATALVVVDMQKDFCAPDGLAGTRGRDVGATQPLIVLGPGVAQHGASFLRPPRAGGGVMSKAARRSGLLARGSTRRDRLPTR